MTMKKQLYNILIALIFVSLTAASAFAAETIFGTVTNTLNEPISGVFVQLVNISNSGQVFASTTTSSNGFYNLSFDVVTGIYNQTFEKNASGYTSFSRTVVIIDNSNNEGNTTLGPALTNAIQGTVTRSCNGNAIGGATITAVGNETFNITTNSSGSYTRFVLDNVYNVTASASGYTSITNNSINVTANVTQNFALTPTGGCPTGGGSGSGGGGGGGGGGGSGRNINQNVFLECVNPNVQKRVLRGDTLNGKFVNDKGKEFLFVYNLTGVDKAGMDFLLGTPYQFQKRGLTGGNTKWDIDHDDVYDIQINVITTQTMSGTISCQKIRETVPFGERFSVGQNLDNVLKKFEDREKGEATPVTSGEKESETVTQPVKETIQEAVEKVEEVLRANPFVGVMIIIIIVIGGLGVYFFMRQV